MRWGGGQGPFVYFYFPRNNTTNVKQYFYIALDVDAWHQTRSYLPVPTYLIVISERTSTVCEVIITLRYKICKQGGSP